MSLTVLDKQSLILDGRPVVGAYADLYAGLVEVRVRETITGASTCTLSVVDGKGAIRNSGLLVKGVTAVLDGVGFELVRASRGVDGRLEIELEDMAVAALRKHTAYRKVAAGVMSRVGFCQTLIREEPWITVNAAPGVVSKEELARGSASSTTTSQAAGGTPLGGIGNYGLDASAGAAIKADLSVGKASSKTSTTTEPEDTWDACSRIMGEINWRVFAVRKTVTIAPDAWILARGTAFDVSVSSPGVEEVTWDFDTGQPSATANLKVRCGTPLTMPVGSRVALSGEGPANGDWLVESIERTDRSPVADVSLIRPAPELPEPSAASASLSDLANLGEGGWPSSLGELEALLGGLGAPKGTGSASANALVERFVQYALAQAGKRYVWGATGPTTFDCSGLVMWCTRQVATADRDAHDRGTSIPSFGRTVGDMLGICRRAGTLMSVEQAIATRGALLIRGPNSHIAISLGNGNTMEAKGRAYGCGIFEARGRGWTTGAWVPGITVSAGSDRSGRAS